MRRGQLEVRAGGYLGSPFGVLVRRYLEPGKRDLDRRQLGLVLVLDGERVCYILAICLTDVRGHCACLSCFSPKLTVNLLTPAKRAHMGKLVFRNRSSRVCWSHAAIEIASHPCDLGHIELSGPVLFSGFTVDAGKVRVVRRELIVVLVDVGGPV